MATALRGFNDLGRSVAPTFLSRNRFYLQLVYLIGNNAAEGENYITPWAPDYTYLKLGS